MTLDEQGRPQDPKVLVPCNTLLTLGSVKVTSGASFAWGNELTASIQGGITFFGYRDYDVMPDGDRFVTGVVADSSAAGLRARQRVPAR